MLLKTIAELSGTDSFLFACYHEQDKKNRPYHFFGTIEHYADQLKDLNSKGYGIYYTVNQTIGQHRSKKDIKAVRALWIDDDAKDKTPLGSRSALELPVPPSAIVETSPNKFHKYWFISQKNLPQWDKLVAQWESAQLSLAQHYGGDLSAIDLPRVLRIPGYFNMKDPSKPSLVSDITETAVAPEYQYSVYDWESLSVLFSLDQSTPYEQEQLAKQNAADPDYLAKAIQAILSGENYNNSITTLTQHFANQGYTQATISSMIEGFMQAAPVKDDRWHARMKHIPVYVATALEKAAELNVPDIDISGLPLLDTRVNTAPDMVIPWPPGLLGDLATSVYNAQPYQNQTVAVATALGIVAGVAGRKFNISQTGLNLYLTILMESGAGKDSIARFANNFLGHFNELGTSLKFMGPKRFTGPSGIIKTLKDNRSQLCIFTEAGFMFKSSAGDQAGIIRTILDLYTKSGFMDYSGAEVYSSTENSLPILRAPSLTIINEATPGTFLEVLNDRNAAMTGELARMNIFRVSGAKPFFNDDVNFSIPTPLVERFSTLLRICLQSLHADDPQAYHFELPSQFREYANYCVSCENKAREEQNEIAATTYSRLAVKCLKLSAICALLNPNSLALDSLVDMQTNPLTISQEDWAWAMSVCDAEIVGLATMWKGISNSDLDSLVDDVIMPVVTKFFAGHYTHPSMQLPQEYKLKGIFSYSLINQIIRFSARLKKLPTAKGYSPLQTALNYMCDIGLLKPVSDEELIQITKLRNATKAVYSRDQRSNRRRPRSTYYQVTKDFIERSKFNKLQDSLNGVSHGD
jgi:hypothetical protein